MQAPGSRHNLTRTPRSVRPGLFRHCCRFLSVIRESTAPLQGDLLELFQFDHERVGSGRRRAKVAVSIASNSFPGSVGKATPVRQPYRSERLTVATQFRSAASRLRYSPSAKFNPTLISCINHQRYERADLFGQCRYIVVLTVKKPCSIVGAYRQCLIRQQPRRRRPVRACDPDGQVFAVVQAVDQSCSRRKRSGYFTAGSQSRVTVHVIPRSQLINLEFQTESRVAHGLCGDDGKR